MIWVELAVASEAVQQSLYVRPEHSVKPRVVHFVKMLSQTIPKVE